MKTMFTMGFAPQQAVFGFGYHPSMGQDTGAPMNLTGDSRDKLLSDINRGAEEYKIISNWRATNGNWQMLLGSDLKKFNDDMANGDAFASVALGVQTKLNSTSPWLISEQEWNDSNSWVIFVDDAMKIMRAHGMAAPQVVSAPPAPSPISPLAVGVGAAAAVGLIAVLLS